MKETDVDLCEVCARLEWARYELLKRGFVPPLRFTLGSGGGPVRGIQQVYGTAITVPVQLHYADASHHEAEATVTAAGTQLAVGTELVQT
jgi:hypothetical protein